MPGRTYLWAIVLCLPHASIIAATPASVTRESLIRELSDLANVCRLPNPPYRLIERSSTLPLDESATGERVLFESPGPGALVRLWIAPWKGAAGTLRIHLHGQTEPVVNLTSTEAHTGPMPPFIIEQGPALLWTAPVPYPSGVRVTWESAVPSEAVHYQVSARAYPQGTVVEAYSPEHTPNGSASAAHASDQARHSFPMKLSAEQPAFEIRPATRGNMITELRLNASDVDPETLRGTILTLTFDGRSTVRAPLGDFFGGGPGPLTLSSFPMQMSPEGEFVCRWPMPFLERVSVSIEGAGEVVEEPSKRSKPRRLRLPPLFRRKDRKRAPNGDKSLVAVASDPDLQGTLVVQPIPWDKETLYFHAHWSAHQDQRMETPLRWPAAEISGRGVYVGSVLQTANPTKDPWTHSAWRLFTDGQERPVSDIPSIPAAFGATIPPHATFSRTLHGRPRFDGPRAFGFTSFYRWRILDRIPFESQCKLEAELTHSSHQAAFSLASMTYWYADAYHAQDVPRIAEDQARVPSLPAREVPRIAGAIEGEGLTALRFDGEAPVPESMVHFEDQGPWSGDAHLAWRGGMPGNELVLLFDAPADGRFRVGVFLSKGPDYGIHRLEVNETAAGDPIDLFNPELVRMPMLDLGVYELKRGANRLLVRTVSSARAASPKNCAFGLDCLHLTPVPDATDE